LVAEVTVYDIVIVNEEEEDEEEKSKTCSWCRDSRVNGGVEEVGADH